MSEERYTVVTEELRREIRRCIARHCGIRNLCRATSIQEKSLNRILKENKFVSENLLDKFFTHVDSNLSLYSFEWVTWAELGPHKRKPLIHGTVHGYNVYECRCEECKATYNANRRKLAAKKVKPHGTYTRYLRGCKCQKCLAAAARVRYNKSLAMKKAKARDLTLDAESAKVAS